MTSLTTGLDTALSADRVLVFGGVQIDLPAATLRLLDGSGEVPFNGGTFLGEDPAFGVLAAISSLADGAGDDSPAINITILPNGNTAAATLAAPTMQGSLVQAWMGAIDPATGLVIPDPYLVFLGEIDVPTLRAGADGRTLEYECVSVMERFFAEEEGQRLSDSFHQSVWPGETAFFDVTGIEQTVYWGVAPPAGTIVVGSSGGGQGSFGEQIANRLL